MAGFFSSAELVTSRKYASSIPKCGTCGLFELCTSPKMVVEGQGRLGILVIGEAPTKVDDDVGSTFKGEGGRYLRNLLTKYGIDLDMDCWRTNAIICRPTEDKAPTDREIDYCQANLINTIDKLQPDVILPFGRAAVRSLLGHVWRDEIASIGTWVGWQIPSQRPNAWIAPNWGIDDVIQTKPDDVGRVLFEKYVAAACVLRGKPWATLPEFEKQIKIVLDPEEAAFHIRQGVAAEGPAAFDYETDRLKPYAPDAAIYSCSICFGGARTLAYPWVGEAAIATQEFLRSTTPKIACNLKFEDGWTRAKLGHSVRAWAWDTLQGAHVLDCRQGVSSIKFQSFVRLGAGSYDDKVKPFLVAKDSTSVNRIRDCHITDLLLYNALDSLYEYKVAEIQARELGFDLWGPA